MRARAGTGQLHECSHCQRHCRLLPHGDGVNGVLTRINPEANLAAAGALALGSGIGIALAGAMTDQPTLGLVGALLAGTAFVLLAALGTLDEVGFVLMTLPLPAL